MKYLLLFLFFCLSFGQLQRVSIEGTQAHIYFHDIFLLLFVVGALYKHLRHKSKAIFIASKPFLPLVACGFVSFVVLFFQFDLYQNMIGLAYLLRLWLYFAFFITLGLEKSENLALSLKVITIMTLAFSYVQYIVFPNFWPFVYLGWDPHVSRVVGTFFDPTTAGAIFIMLALACASLYKKSLSNTYLMMALLFIPLLFLTYSRITYIIVLSIVGYICIAQRRIALLLGVSVVVLVTFFALPRPEGEGVKLERIFSIQSRIEANNQGLVLFKQNPIIGIGFNRIQFAKEKISKYVSGNSASGFPSTYMTTLVSMGVLGLVAFGYMLVTLWRTSNFIQRGLLIVLIIGGIFENVFYVSFVFIVFSLCYASLKARKTQ